VPVAHVARKPEGGAMRDDLKVEKDEVIAKDDVELKDDVVVKDEL
jgi:hypothetical protein